MSDKKSFTKAELIQMNSSPQLGFNWIKNLNDSTISDTQLLKIHPTGDACMMSGRFYVALPADTIITKEIRNKYNLF